MINNPTPMPGTETKRRARRTCCPADPASGLLRRGQVLSRYGITHPTISRWTNLRGFPSPLRVGRTPFWRLEDLVDWERSLSPDP